MILVAFLMYWMACFAACYLVVEQAQNYYYEEPTPGYPWKVAIGSFIMAIFATILPIDFITMFSSSFHWTLLHGIVWFLIFTLLFQFHPRHALILGVLTLLAIPGLATMAIDSLRESGRPTPVAAPKAEPLGPRPSGGAPALPPNLGGEKSAKDAPKPSDAESSRMEFDCESRLGIQDARCEIQKIGPSPWNGESVVGTLRLGMDSYILNA